MTPVLEQRRNVRRAAVIAVALAILVATVASAQGRNETFKARLSPLGVTNATVSTTTGVGTITATLEGSTLKIQGSFEKLTGSATDANLRRGPKAIPGPVVFPLEFTKASSGNVTGTLTLTAAQVDDLRAGRLYVQVHSERAPEGSIRGWLLR